MFPGLDLYYTDLALLTTTGEELDDLSDLSVRGVKPQNLQHSIIIIT